MWGLQLDKNKRDVKKDEDQEEKTERREHVQSDTKWFKLNTKDTSHHNHNESHHVLVTILLSSLFNILPAAISFVRLLQLSNDDVKISCKTWSFHLLKHIGVINIFYIKTFNRVIWTLA